MKMKSLAISALLLTGLIASHQVSATPYCTLSASQSYVPFGQPFTYGISINDQLPGPLPPPWYRVFRVVFYGYKNGVADIPASGETYPGLFPYYNSTLTGFANVGPFTGNYIRFALIYQGDSTQPYCSTNAVNVTLQ